MNTQRNSPWERRASHQRGEQTGASCLLHVQLPSKRVSNPFRRQEESVQRAQQRSAEVIHQKNTQMEGKNLTCLMNVWLKTLSVKRLDTLTHSLFFNPFFYFNRWNYPIRLTDCYQSRMWYILHDLTRLNTVKAVALRLHHSSTHSPHLSIVYWKTSHAACWSLYYTQFLV